MAINAEYAPVREEGDGSKQDFDFNFKVFEAADLVVSKLNRTTDAETALTVGVDYTVTINTITDGGTVSYTVAPAADEDSFIRRSVALTQPADIPTNNIFREVQIENALDRLTMICQQLQVEIDRCVKVAETSDLAGVFPDPEIDQYLRWNDAGTQLINSDVVITTTAYDGTISHGLDAAKSATPGQGDIYLATDTGLVYFCKVAETWSSIVPAATTAASGISELATVAETSAGTDTGRVVTPAGLAGSVMGQKTLIIPVFAPGDTVSTGDGKCSFSFPSTLNGMSLKALGSHVYTVSSSGLPTVQIRKKKIADATEVDVLSTKLSIDENERDSSTATTAAVIDTANDDVATGDEYHVDVDIAGTGTKGLDVRLTFGI